MAEQKPALEPIHNKTISDRYLKFALEFREPVSCLLEERKEGFRAQVVEWEKEKLHLEILPPSYDALSAETKLALSQPGLSLILSYSVSEVLVFAHVKVKFTKARRLETEIQFPILKLQRRNALRVKIVPGHKAELKINGQVFPVYDISAGGLGIVAGPEDLRKFPAQANFPGCEISFLNQTAIVDLKCMSQNQSRIKDRWKIGFQFLNLPKPMENLVMREAYLENQQMWTRGKKSN